MVFIVAIDGPAGSGKSSVTRAVAKELGLTHVDTGAIYRALALKAEQDGIDPDDEQKLAQMAKNLRIQFVENNRPVVLLDGRDVTDEIRAENISQKSSMVSKHPAVRQNLIELQRQLGRRAKNGAVLEGRDIGTVIFPDADIKFFITASDETRAKRRFLQLGQKEEYQTILSEIQRRDQRDQGRQVAPLVPAEDAILIDTSQMDLAQVVEQIKKEIQHKKKTS